MTSALRQHSPQESVISGVMTALSIPASSGFRGNDGSWSTFQIEVGTPPATFYVLPATSISSVWLINEQACTTRYPATCPFDRGNLFTPNASSTYIEYLCDGHLYCGLPLSDSQNSLGYTGNAAVGFDTMYLNGKTVALKNQVVASYAVNVMFLGLLGLSNYTNRVRSNGTKDPSPLQTLQSQEVIPSAFWGYNAGAYYRSSPGSLTFGGYDASRGNGQNSTLIVSLGQDSTRDLSLVIRDIKMGANSADLPADSVALIDSLIPEIWLPIKTCQSFEEQFGLVWNSTINYYLINDTQRANLLKQNPNVTFTLAANSTTSHTVDITLPYAAFDLELSYPLANITNSDTTLRYFPLRRANSTIGYSLGRTFLQEA